MLFDEKDLLVLENTQCRAYFEEILQCYYSKNYRATIVLLYSFVIYDLYMKLQTMSNEGNGPAVTKLAEVKTMIADDEKYSTVEKTIIQFFRDNCALYFNKFNTDIDYLIHFRNECAHLKVDDNSLFEPKDYQVRMLICSMFDNILSVKAPFITDLFTIVQSEVERYSGVIFYIGGFTDAIKNEITNNYLKRMTDESLKKSYKTFLKLLLVTDDEDCRKNIYGLFAFTYSLTDYLINNSKLDIFTDKINEIIPNIDIEKLKNNDIKRDILFELVKKFPRIADLVQSRQDLFEYITETIFTNPRDFKTYYPIFYVRNQITIYVYFNAKTNLHITTLTDGFYNAVFESPDFNLVDFLTLMMKSVPKTYGFHDADCYMNCLLNQLNKLNLNDLETLRLIYYTNNQLYGRGRNNLDLGIINNYINTLLAQTPTLQNSGQITNGPGTLW